MKEREGDEKESGMGGRHTSPHPTPSLFVCPFTKFFYFSISPDIAQYVRKCPGFFSSEQNRYSTRIFEKAADENLSAFRETTLNHGFYGREMLQNDAK